MRKCLELANARYPITAGWTSGADKRQVEGRNPNGKLPEWGLKSGSPALSQRHNHYNMHTYIHTYIHTYVHTHTHACTHTRMHTHTHTHTHLNLKGGHPAR